MILRYFYIYKYNEVAQNLDVNLGGKYKFYYKFEENKLYVVEDETYVENLYSEYSVISDISAILGKNSAGKTTILRMINSIFNGFNYTEQDYIILFENEQNYILYTNFEQLGCNESILLKKMNRVIQKKFRALEELYDVGLIYFSNIFDRSTPFQGNSNMIDISTNHAFEIFYEERLKSGIKRNDEKSSIMIEYKSNCILQEIDFLLDIDKIVGNDIINLLFEIPKQLELGFVQVLPNYGNGPFCENYEYTALLESISKSLEVYFSNEQNNSKATYCNEIIYYLLFDQLYQLCNEERYDMLGALDYWRDKIKEGNWDLSGYYQIILDKLYNEDTLEEVIDNDFYELMEGRKVEYEDILGDFEWIKEKLDELQDIEYNFVIRKIMRIQSFVITRMRENKNSICYFLNRAVDSLRGIQIDLLSHDYDLYNLSYIYEAYTLIEKSYELFIYNIDEEEIDEYYDEIDIGSMDVDIDADTDRHINLLKDVINMFIDFTNKYELDFNNSMLKIKLDNQNILEFIYKFRELNCETVELDAQRNDISSGHSAYLDMCARINAARKSGEIHKKENVILLIDEGDIYLHPEKQLAFMNNLLKLLQILYKGKKVQVIVTSNSPFIISDIQTSNILYLENKDNIVSTTKSSISNTFASNINCLLLDSFFVKNGLIGEYAFEKIDGILRDILKNNITQDKIEYIKKVLGIIGEPIIRRKLEKMLFCNMEYYNVRREIEYYEKRICQLKRFSGREND